MNGGKETRCADVVRKHRSQRKKIGLGNFLEVVFQPKIYIIRSINSLLKRYVQHCVCRRDARRTNQIVTSYFGHRIATTIEETCDLILFQRESLFPLRSGAVGGFALCHYVLGTDSFSKDFYHLHTRKMTLW